MRRDHRVIVFGAIPSSHEEKLRWLEREWEWRVMEDNASETRPGDSWRGDDGDSSPASAVEAAAAAAAVAAAAAAAAAAGAPPKPPRLPDASGGGSATPPRRTRRPSSLVARRGRGAFDCANS